MTDMTLKVGSASALTSLSVIYEQVWTSQSEEKLVERSKLINESQDWMQKAYEIAHDAVHQIEDRAFRAEAADLTASILNKDVVASIRSHMRFYEDQMTFWENEILKWQTVKKRELCTSRGML